VAASVDSLASVPNSKFNSLTLMTLTSGDLIQKLTFSSPAMPLLAAKDNIFVYGIKREEGHLKDTHHFTLFYIPIHLFSDTFWSKSYVLT